MGKWTPEIVEKLKAMWEDGASGAEIGRMIGYSRNAVLGKIHRLGLSEAGRQGVSRKKKIRHIPGIKAGRTSFRKTINYKPLPVPKNEPVKPLMLDLEGLTRHQCRWPYGEAPEIKFCGCATVGGGSYCSHHRDRSLSQEQLGTEKDNG